MSEARVVVVGAGPAGLAAADVIASAGHAVAVYDHMPSPARKFLLAGRGGLNLTHSEPLERFVTRYGAAAQRLAPAVHAYPPEALRAFAATLGEETFVGSSGRVFPKSFKASPLLRAWLQRLGGLGVTFHPRHRLVGFDGAAGLVMETAEGARMTLTPAATVLALGGASWPRMGSDGGFVSLFQSAGIAVTPFAPSNMGVEIPWSAHLIERFAGAPVKRVALSIEGVHARGEAIITRRGLEGGAVYAVSAAIRDAVARAGRAQLVIDLRPDLTTAELATRLAKPRGPASLSNFLRKAAGLSPVAIGLLREAHGKAMPQGDALAAAIKAVALTVTGVMGLERAISSAGGVAWAAVDDTYQLKARPGTFVVGEMLDWEAPTGGYLLQAAFSTGRAAGQAIVARLAAA